MPVRRPFIAGNWKMHKTVHEALALVQDLKRLLARMRHCDLMIAPPYTALYPVAQRLADTNIALGAQELFPVDAGAYTGAVSAPMLREVGCTHVLVGHSERRQHFGEALASSGQRVQAALRAGLLPMLCVGETLAERDAGRTWTVVEEQLAAGLAGLDTPQLAKVSLAYEPVWAIGTGRVATPQQAQEVHAAIRTWLRHRCAEHAESMRVLYGGSVKADNAASLLQQPEIDGALVGGASLDAEAFAAIAQAAAG